MPERTDRTEKLNLTISASRVGAYYHNCCSRSAAYCILRDPQKAGWDKRDERDSVLKKAGIIWEREVLKHIADKGVHIKAKESTQRPGEYEDYTVEETIEILKNAEDGYIYQSTIEAPQSFKEDSLYGHDTHSEFLVSAYEGTDRFIHAGWSICKPDLIHITHDEDGEPAFSVIDIKHARSARMEHKVQVAIYVRLLKALMEENGIRGRVDTDHGYVWNFKKDEPSAFPLDIVMPYVDRYFADVLPDTMIKLRRCRESTEEDIYNKTFPALPGMKCEGCDNFKNCVAWQQVHEPVTLMPYLSTAAQKYLREHNVPLDIDGFEEYTEIHEEEMADSCLGLRRFLRTKDQSVEALRNKLTNSEIQHADAVTKDVTSLLMPAGQDVRIILTAQRDEVTDDMYALGLRINVSKPGVDLFGTGLRKVTSQDGAELSFAEPYEMIYIAERPKELKDKFKLFIGDLYDKLSICNDYNNDKEEWQDRLSVQAYVCDSYERDNIEEAVLNELINGEEDDEYRIKLLCILYWLQGESMVTAVDEQAQGVSDDMPVVVITAAVKQLYSIPSFISYGLDTMCEALLESQGRNGFKRYEKYAYLLSNKLKCDAIHEIWDAVDKTDKADKLEKLIGHLKIRLTREDSLVSIVQKQMRNRLKRWPQKYVLNRPSFAGDVRASKLYIENEYEGLLAHQEYNAVRMEDSEEMAQEGRIYHLVLKTEGNIKRDGFSLFPGTKPGRTSRFRIKNDYYGRMPFSGILVPAGDERALEAVRKLTGRKDDERKEPLEAPDGTYLYYWVQNIKTGIDRQGTFITLDRIVDGRNFAMNTEFYLYERYSNSNAKKVNEALGAHYEYLYPENYYNELNDETDEHCYDYGPNDGKSFTVSQKKAFDQFFRKSITLLLGPPGSGKTDFIARALITICRYYRDVRGQNLSVLVTANSHAAINNILSALASKCTGADGEPDLYKLNKIDDSNNDSLPGITLARDYIPKDEDGFSSSSVYRQKGSYPFIMGSTCYPVINSFMRYNNKCIEGAEFYGYDIIVIDEASQVRSMDAMLDFGAAARNCRFLIVGDENQLPPIIAGKYKTQDQDINFYGSVFRLFYDTAKYYGLDYLKPLEEQFRMNEILSRYPAREIYDKDIVPGDGRKGYHAFDFNNPQGLDLNIAKRRLQLTPDENRPDEDDVLGKMVRDIVDPDHPMVLVRLCGGAPKSQQEAETELVTALTVYLRDHMIERETGLTYPDDEDADKRFWGYALEDGAMGIISPHHEQINRLRKAVSDASGMQSEILFIDTVDKLQGQQREAVIVSYGVNDPERAALELEFIYSRNRLNVAMTRGKSKMICILSDVMTDRPMETLDIEDEDILRGIDYISGLQGFMSKEEEDTACAPPAVYAFNGVQIEVYRKRMREV